nr:MAG TPA: intron associated endonuclease [Bacteriophage sp.]
MKYIVYKTINKINNKIYIGVHKTEDPEIFDGYLSNGVYVQRPSSYSNPKTHFQFAIKKYGVENFIRTVVKVFDVENDAYKLESELVNEEFIKREDTYNLVPGGRDVSQFMVKVYMYDIEGNFEMEFESLVAAAKYLSPTATGGGHLPRAIKRRHQFLGHQFSYEKFDNIGPIKAMKNRLHIEKAYSGGKVGKFDEYGNLLETFDTMTDCIKAEYKNAKQVALGKRKLCMGFVFKYLN